MSKYILLVEDNPDDVELAKLALKRAQIANKLVIAEDGQEAVDFLFGSGKYADRDPADKPGLILLDLKLPKVDGLQVLEKVRAGDKSTRTPIVMFTSSTDERDRSESLRLGADDYICKPGSLTQSVEIMKRLRADWLT
jgi:two-component system, response regulator